MTTLDNSFWTIFSHSINCLLKANLNFGQLNISTTNYQTSINKASLDARKQLANTLESEVVGVTNRVIEETGLGGNSEFVDILCLATVFIHVLYRYS